MNLLKQKKYIKYRFLYKMILLFFLIFSINITHGKTISCQDINEVKENIHNFLKNYDINEVLIIFDIDLTLTIPVHRAVQIPNILKHKDIFKKIKTNLTATQQDLFLSFATKLVEQKLIESNTPDVLYSLQQLGIKTIALSAALTGSLAHIKKLEKWRYQTLKNLGIDFSSSFPSKDYIIFQDIPSYLGNYPVFYKGILSTNGRSSSKGNLLVNFLEKNKLTPKIIILVDDKKENIDDVRYALNLYNPNINFQGLEYLAGSRYTDGEISEVDFINFWTNCINKVQDINY